MSHPSAFSQMKYSYDLLINSWSLFARSGVLCMLRVRLIKSKYLSFFVPLWEFKDISYFFLASVSTTTVTVFRAEEVGIPLAICVVIY